MRPDERSTTDAAAGDEDDARRAGAGRAGRALRATARGARAAGVATGRGARAAGHATGAAAGYTFRQARRASHAEGAGQSGLSRLIELHAFNAAGDAAVAISLAGTLFFQVPTDQARGQVALFLGLTMLPFAIVAPLIGPFLDRFSHGRRWAIGATLATRAFLCWVLADAVSGDSVALFPAALGVLVASKAYGVTRAAAVPRLLPDQLTLVRANSRISLAGVAGATVSAPLAVLASTFGAQWSLRYAFGVFVVGTILAILLPGRVDSSAGERESGLPGVGRRSRVVVPRPVVAGLRSNAGLRMLSGFLTMFMAFLLRNDPFPGWEDRPELLLGLVIGSAGLGSTIGIALGSVLRAVRPGGRRRRRAARRRRRHGGGRRVLRAADGGAARPDRRPGPVLRQALPRRADPARDPRPHPRQRVRPLRDAAAAVLGGRRLRRHRAAAGAAARLSASPRRSWSASRRGCSTRPAARSPARARARRPARAAASPSPWPARAPGAARRGSPSRCSRAGGRGPR